MVLIKDVGLKDIKCPIYNYRTLRHPLLFDTRDQEGRTVPTGSHNQ